MGECLEEGVEGCCSIAVGLQQLYKFRTDDGTCGILLGRLQCLFVRDAKTYHAGIAQVHGIDATEVLLLLFVERLLGTRGGSRRDHIDKAVGMLIDEADALLAGFRCDEHDNTDVILVSGRFDTLQLIIEGQVRDDDTANATFYTRLTERVNAVLHDGVQIAHQHEWDLYFVLDGFQLAEEFL